MVLAWWRRPRDPQTPRPSQEPMERVDALATNLLVDSAELKRLVRQLRVHLEDR